MNNPFAIFQKIVEEEQAEVVQSTTATGSPTLSSYRSRKIADIEQHIAELRSGKVEQNRKSYTLAQGTKLARVRLTDGPHKSLKLVDPRYSIEDVHWVDALVIPQRAVIPFWTAQRDLMVQGVFDAQLTAALREQQQKREKQAGVRHYTELELAHDAEVMQRDVIADREEEMHQAAIADCTDKAQIALASPVSPKRVRKFA